MNDACAAAAAEIAVRHSPDTIAVLSEFGASMQHHLL